MVNEDPRQGLARRLRMLREERWPRIKITQPQLATALGCSVPLISSWETERNPKLPPIPRLEAYATFFATERSLENSTPRLLPPAELTEAERQVKEDLLRELMSLRNRALGASADPVPAATGLDDTGYWRFQDGETITLVCAQLPQEILQRMPYTNPDDPDYIALYTYADLDALFELYGYVRAVNPRTQVNLRLASELASDDYTTHLVALGGVDWNLATREVLEQLQLPVEQVARDTAEGGYFEVSRKGGKVLRLAASLRNAGDRRILYEDVAMFARAVNPYRRDSTVTMCIGMYGQGTLGAVRALTDVRFLDKNTRHLRERFGDGESFCILSKVRVINGKALTPDWTVPANRLFEWPDTR